MATPTLVVRRPIFPDVLADLRQHATVIDAQSGTALEGETLAAALKVADALLVPATEPVGKSLLDSAPKLRLVANIGVGHDNIDVPACAARGITVTNTPGVVDDATADLAFALLLAAARRVVDGDAFVRSGAWAAGTQPSMGVDVHHRVLGIVGLGRIGRTLVRRARGFEMTVLYHNRRRLPDGEELDLGVTYATLDELLTKADFVLLQIPASPETHHLIGAAELAKMKSTAVLVNTARGGVVDDAALIAALQKGTIAAAGLDVFENEPQVHPGLLSLHNVVLAPHVGSATLATRHAMVRRAADNVIAVLSGAAPRDPVNTEA
jgi:lactate dehydrogenase-like 2-hydroxyacid dehydrogenase